MKPDHHEHLPDTSHEGAAASPRGNGFRGALQRWTRRMTLMLVVISTLGTSVGAVTTSEHQALLSLYQATNGNNWLHHANWGGAQGSQCDPDPAKQWFGVTCDLGTGHITIVLLPANNLTGTLPDLSGLAFVHYFDFDDNHLGGPLPSTLGMMTALDTFHATRNRLAGSIPVINTLPALQEFIAPGNFFTGPVPSLSGLAALTNFDVSYNFLSGSMPTLTGLSNLRQFDIEHNAVSGSIPSLAGLDALTAFQVGYNHLSGALPAVPSPVNSLNDGDSTLCPNDLIHRADSSWDHATGEFLLGDPWYQDIQFPGGFCEDLIFSDGVEPRVLPF
jgi:hypothetical protein